MSFPSMKETDIRFEIPVSKFILMHHNKTLKDLKSNLPCLCYGQWWSIIQIVP